MFLDTVVNIVIPSLTQKRKKIKKNWSLKAIVPLSCIYDMKNLEISMIKYKILKEITSEDWCQAKGG